MENENKWKSAFIFLLVLIVVSFVGVGAYFFGKGEINFKKDVASSPTPIQIPSPSPTASSSTDFDLIKQAVYEGTGLSETTAVVTVSTNTGTHAKGGIKEINAVSGAYFIAAKVGVGWELIYSGQSTPTCLEIAPYDFPTDMVLECLDSQGQVVSR